MKSKVLVLVLLASQLSISVATDIETTFPFVAQLYVPEISRPRALIIDSEGHILVSSANSRITAIRETNNGDGTSTVETITIVDGTDLNLTHGIAYHDGYLYASSPLTIYRWPYTPGQFSLLNQSTMETVIVNITDTSNGHNTRTLIFDDLGRFYVTVGSQDNIDNDSSRAKIRRFIFGDQALPIPFNNGEVFADGCRNTVGLGFSNSGTLFAVDNGADLLNRPDLGGAIWPENPGEEMNKFSSPIGSHYGYPWCWSVYNLPDYPPRTQFAWPTFLEDGLHTDEWCQNTNNNVPPVVSMPAHSAPLSIEFYKGGNCGVNGGFPCEAINDPFVAFRGSWHQGVGYGYKVSWYPFDKEEELPTGEVVDIIFSPNSTNSCNSCLRAVGVVFNRDGHLIVTGETTNEIFRVAYNISLPTITYIHHEGETPEQTTNQTPEQTTDQTPEVTTTGESPNSVSKIYIGIWYLPFFYIITWFQRLLS